MKVTRDNTVIELSRNVRKNEPMTGCRKIHHRISEDLLRLGYSVGRDRLFSILREHNMLVKRRKKYKRTTYSNHGYAVAPNRLKKTDVFKANQVFVSDITYISLKRGFAYLFLVTDLYSRKIVGSYLSENLKNEGAIIALRRAVSKVDDTKDIIHHSDRGCQYCCHSFLAELSRHNMLASMTDDNHCYENAVAERVNGILKQEFYIDSTFRSRKQAREVINDAISIYNTERTHWSLGLKTPEEVYAKVA